ncbi:DUF6134 family protein [Terricaulis sp.]|uniref:DUF6134 family protein n=1 Tax=Terricaulis sp. TaxID=2768686 RepID=UPI0037833826
MRSFALAAIAALSLSTAPASAAPSAAGRTEFEVLRNGQPFGRHVITVSGSGDHLTAQSALSMSASAGPITLFRYEQNCTETWSGGSLAGLRCSTLKDGRHMRVSAAVQRQMLQVTGARGQTAFPLGTFPTSWWTRPPEATALSLLNTETGQPMPVRVTRIGRETIMVAGRPVQAEHIRVQGTVTADLWYDENGRWIGCSVTIRGQHITYRLASPLDAAPA